MARKIIIQRQSGGFGSSFSGFLIGGLIGAAVALLAAPQSGMETRQMLGQKANELKDRASDIADQTMTKANQAVSSVRSQASDMIDKTKQQVAGSASRTSDMLDQASQKSQDVANRASSTPNPLNQ
jgi:gas vesicle protein